MSLLPHPERRAILQAAVGLIIRAYSGDPRMPRPFLDLGNVGRMDGRIGGGGRP